MHSGSFAKIPVVMGEYTSELNDGKKKHPRSWFSNDMGRLYYVKADGVTVIDVWEAIIKEHQKDGSHEKLSSTEPFKLDLQQYGDSLLDNILEIYRTGEQYSLNITQALSLGLDDNGVVINEKEDGQVHGYPRVISPLPVNLGGTGKNTLNNSATTKFLTVSSDNVECNTYLPFYNPNTSDTKYQLVDYFTLCNIIKNINDRLAIIETNIGDRGVRDNIYNEINNLYNKISDINRSLTSYVTKASLDNTKKKINDFVGGLPKQIYDMIFPETKFNGIEKVRILEIKVIADQKDKKQLSIKINKNTGWGISPAGKDVYYRDIYNKDTCKIGLYGSESQGPVDVNGVNNSTRWVGIEDTKNESETKIENWNKIFNV